VFWFL